MQKAFSRWKKVAPPLWHPYGQAVAVQLTILGSGSSGNSAYLETEDARILIDAGFSVRQIRQRLATIGRAPEGLSGILITHEHTDHINGLLGLATKLNIPVYCNRLTKDAIEYQFQTKLDCRIFGTGSSFELGDVIIETFSIPHDASDPVGFFMRTTAGQIGFLTDLGHATKLVLERVRASNVLVLESNHDLKLLQESSRPWSLKQRIAGRHGHLSNTEAADAAEVIMSADLRHLYLGHLSRECNRPEIAERTMHEKLQKIGATHVRIEVTSQDLPCSTLTLVPPAPLAAPQPPVQSPIQIQQTLF
ncbi:MBL fold metallo-hydrolase [Pedosphaera parvula]|uniref:Beta-lactamase domain protein n=1 Tax=Pedosphaera parvula (strain Ellin514) TaxID=320771 RepID=B9XGP5_PEDPL|nr:MBL fold metallo-hydrolase [Pedosphaera parvula]EEF61096.1 beta-lactamase domain protein [Pedosphaera parvula Ellin514]